MELYDDALLSASASVFRLLGRILGTEVDAEFYRALVAEREKSPVLRFFIDDTRPIHERLESLSVEYCRLFIGPRPVVTPYASLQLGGSTLRGTTEDAVMRFAEEANIVIELRAPIAAADHAAVAFAILGELYEQLATRTARAQSRPDLLRQFLTSTVLPWVPQFLERVELETREPFYGGACNLGRQVLAQAPLLPT